MNTNKNKITFHCKRNVDTTNNNHFTTSKNADASSMSALDANGRALINLSKMSFRGNISDSCLKERLEDMGFSTYVVEEILKLPITQKNEAIELSQEGIIPESLIVEFVQKDEDIKSKMFELIQKGISAKVTIEDIDTEWDGKGFIDLNKEEVLKKCDKISEMLDKDISADSISMMMSSYSEISEETAKRFSYFIKKIKSSPEILMKNIFSLDAYIADMVKDEETYNRAVLLLDMGMTDLAAIADISESEDIFKKFIEFLNSGYSEDDARIFSHICDESCLKKTQELIRRYSISAYLAGKIVTSDKSGKYENALHKLSKENITPNIELLELSDELLDDVICLIKEGCSEDEISSIISNDYKNINIKKLIEENNKNNKKWNDFIVNSPNSDYYHKELAKQDIYFLKRQIFDNQFYSPDEYIKAFLYLKNLRTINGENILGSESFSNKIKTHGLVDFIAKEQDMLYRNIEAILSIDPQSKKIKYIQKILELIQNGKINPSAFRKLSNLNDLKRLESMILGVDFERKTNSSEWDISNNLTNDIELIGNEEFRIENYLDKYIPKYRSEEEGIKSSKIGDAFVLDNENYIRIKTEEDKSEIVNLKRETYARLFPPIERFLTSQQIMGNCYCIETLMSMYCNNNTRISLLRHIKEDDNGNITIKIGNYKPVTFKEGKLPENENREIYSSGADGYMLFEYAYSCALVEDKIKEAQEQLSDEKLTEFNDFINLNPDNFFIYKDDDEIKWSTYKEAIKKGYYKKMALSPFDMQPYKTFNNLLLGNGGLQNDVYKKFGYKPKMYMAYVGSMMLRDLSKKELIKQLKDSGFDVDEVSTLNKAKKLLKSKNSLKNHQVQIGLGAHAYCLTQEADENGNIVYYLYNPHNQGFPIKFTNLDDMLDKVSQITIIKINN